MDKCKDEKLCRISLLEVFCLEEGQTEGVIGPEQILILNILGLLCPCFNFEAHTDTIMLVRI